MLKKIKSFFLCYLAISFSIFGYESDFITYDWLIHNALETGHTEHIPTF